MTPLVFLHGLGTGPEGWEPQLTHFGRTRAVFAPGVRGLDASLDEPTAPFDLCGLSLGALVALHHAARSADVRRLVVCAGFAILPVHVRRKVRRTAHVLAMLPSPIVRAGLSSEVPEAWREGARDSLRKLRSREIARTMLLAADFDARAELASISSPTLVLCGEHDAINAPLSADLANRLPNGRFAFVAGAGHVANLDAPDRFNALVEEFLA